MAKRSRVQAADEYDDEYEDELDEEQDQRPARRKRGRAQKPRSSGLVWLASRLFVVLLLFSVLIFFAPWIVGATGLWKPILGWAAPEVAGKVEIASLRLGWISGIDARGIVVRDPSGKSLAELERIASRKTLLELALNQQDLGTFDVYGPKVNVVLRGDGSNVEDFLAALPKSQSQSPTPGFSVTLNAGSIALDDQVAGRKWQLEQVNLDLVWPAAATAAKTGKFTAALKPVVEAVAKSEEVTRLAARDENISRSEMPTMGEIAAEFSWQPGIGEPATLGAGQAQVRLGGVATEIAEGALRRFVSDIRPQGPLTLDASFTWADDGKTQHAVVKRLAAPRLSIIAPELFAHDQISIAINSGTADVELGPGKLTIRDLRLDSNLVQLSGRGAAQMPELSSSNLLASLNSASGSGDVELTGQADLAELARQLPGTLRLREGTEITSGIVNASLSSKSDQGQRRWQGSIKTADLRATSAGRKVAFDQPLEVSFSIRQTAQGPVIDELIGTASFLNLRGSGTIAAGTIAADADLDKLAAELGQIIDFGDTRLAGTLAADLHWSQAAGDVWQATAKARVQQFEVRAANLAPWRESDLQINAEAAGVLGGASLERLDTARLTVVSTADRLEVELTEPVQELSANSAWPAKFTLQGDLAAWAARLQPFAPLGDWRLAGTIDAIGAGRFAAQSSELAQTTIQIQQFAVDGPGLAIREPIVKVETAGAWDTKPRTLTLPTLTLASSSLAFRADDLRVVASPTEPTATGLIDFRGDLGRLTNWIGGAGGQRAWQLAGAMTGRVEIGYRGQALAANWAADVENFEYLVPLPRAEAHALEASGSSFRNFTWLWEEPRIHFAGQGTFEPTTGGLKVDQTMLTTASASLAASGTVSKLTTAPAVDLLGEVSYDLELVTQQIKLIAARYDKPGAKLLPYGLDSLQLVGQEKRPFVLKGPLFASAGLTPAGSPLISNSPAAPHQPLVSEQLQGELSLGWQGAQFVGLIAGPAEVRTKLDRGIVNIGPLDIPLSEGRLTTAPRILLNERAAAAIFDRGPVLESVRISPEMCHLWLKYVAPMLADVTRAEGKFSLSLQGGAVPIFDPKKCDVAGTLAIDAAQVGPGPLAQQYLTLAKQLRTLFDPAAGAATAIDPDRGWLLLPKQDVQFEVLNGAVHHRGLTMTVGDVAITTAGSVGIDDQSLSLVASIPVQESWLKSSDGLLATLKGKTIQVPISGTISQPKLDGRVLDNLGKQLAGSAVQGVVDKQLQKGQTILQDELGKGLNRLFGPLQPKPPSPAPPAP